MSLRNYAAEGRVADLCADGGVSDIEIFLEEFRIGLFNEENAKQYIEDCRASRPHRFTVTHDMNDEAVGAFGPNRTLTAQAAFVRKYGESHAREVAARFGTTIGSLKGGTVPEDVKKQISDKNPDASKPTNPWHPSHCDARGYYTARALTLQANAVKGLGAEKAAALAAVHGAKLGAVKYPRKVA